MIKLDLIVATDRVIRRSISDQLLNASVSRLAVGKAAAAKTTTSRIDKLHEESTSIVRRVGGESLVIVDGLIVESAAACDRSASRIDLVADGTEREEVVVDGRVAGDGSKERRVRRVDTRE